MVLTFRSTGVERLSIIEREPDGRQRVAHATRSHAATKLWDLEVEHPNGQTWRGSYTGNKANVVAALDEMLSKVENEWRSDRARDDRRPASTPDHNRRVTDGYAPVRPIPGR